MISITRRFELGNGGHVTHISAMMVAVEAPEDGCGLAHKAIFEGSQDEMKGIMHAASCHMVADGSVSEKQVPSEASVLAEIATDMEVQNLLS